jgi:hypothetical protein
MVWFKVGYKMIGQTFGYMRNKVFSELLQNENVIKALVIEDRDFLDVTPNEEQQEYIDNPASLIRNYVYPYKRIFDTATEHKTLICTEFSNFYKKGKNYRDGLVTFYILTPIALEKTMCGIRYDYIGDEIETIFTNTTIGEFNFKSRGDIDVGDRYIGHYITFQVVDFHINN